MSELANNARWRRIYSNDWHAEAFQSLNDSERVVYFYGRTGPQSTSVGIYRISTAVAVEEIGNLTPIEFDAHLDRVCEAFGWRFDPRTRVLWIPTWLDENPPQSPNVCVAWRKLIGNLPDCDLKFEAADAIVRALKERPKAFLEAFGRLPKDLRISKAKPKSQPESNQGLGDSGIQGTERERTGPLRAVAEKRNGKRIERSDFEPVMELIRKALPFIPSSASKDEVFDTIQSFNQREPRPLSLRRSEVVALVDKERSFRSSDTAGGS